MPLMYNSQLVYKSCNYIFWDNYINKYHELGIFSVQDFLDAYDGFTDTQKTSLGATYIMQAMPNDWSTQVDSGCYGDIPPVENVIIKKLSVKKTYDILLCVQRQPVTLSMMKWATDLNTPITQEQWSCVCSNAFDIVEIKLRSFYIKYINRCAQFNNTRHHWHPDIPPECAMCGKGLETWLHVYWDCDLIVPIRTALIAWCTEKICSTTVYSR